MAFPSPTEIERLKKSWSDRFVTIVPGCRADLTRFNGKVGRVITVNWAGKAVVDFADGAWYDVDDFESVLIEVTDDASKLKFDTSANSAQPRPTRQG